METPLPTTDELVAFSSAGPWEKIEALKERFNEKLAEIVADGAVEGLPLDKFSEAIDAPVFTYNDADQPALANVLLTEFNNHQFMLGSLVSKRYRSGKSPVQSIVPYNLNPSVNHTNIGATDDSATRIRAMGAELELGLLRPDGSSPSEADVQAFIRNYETHARRLGITPQVDREACQYQIEVHVAPAVGYHRSRVALDGIMTALAASSDVAGVMTAIFSSYPTQSDFHLTDDPKVHTAVDLMVQLNKEFPEYRERLKVAQERYCIPHSANVVETFRIQGCHIHMDLAGRSEALGLLSFYSLLRSASAVANSAVLKGGPFVNGTCDPELLCTREHIRQTTVTGRTIEVPLSPHLCEGDLDRYAGLLTNERANAVARALLYDDRLGSPISAMHSLIGRIRPDLRTSKRICTLESTGMPINASASRQAAILTDFEFSHTLVENYFRKHGCDLEPMFDDQTLWALIGPMDAGVFREMHDLSDREGSDLLLTTAAGTQMTLAEFYEMKRVYMHKHLTNVAHIAPRDIDEVYTSLQRMLAPPSGETAQTIEQYIYDYKLRSTGNWGLILRNAFIKEGGVPGDHNPDAVLRVVQRVHNAIKARYL